MKFDGGFDTNFVHPDPPPSELVFKFEMLLAVCVCCALKPVKSYFANPFAHSHVISELCKKSSTQIKTDQEIPFTLQYPTKRRFNPVLC